MKSPKFTDLHRYPHGYADAKASGRPGYLKEKFRKLADAQRKTQPESAKVQPLKRRIA